MFKKIVESEQKQFCTSFHDGTTIFFRLLSLKEYHRVLVLKDKLNLDDIRFYEEVYNLCVDEQYRNLGGVVRAGIPAAIGEFIVYYSFNTDNIENDIDNMRGRYTDNNISFYENLKNIIMLAYPAYPPENLDKKDKHELIELFVRAENMLQLKTKGEYTPINTKTLRTPDNTSKIDFAKENKEIANAKLNVEDNPWSRNMPANNTGPNRQAQITPRQLQEVRERAAQRSAVQKSGKLKHTR